MNLGAEEHAVRRAFGENFAQNEPWQALSGGRSNAIWRCGDLVIKLYRSTRSSTLFPNDPDAEECALGALQGTGLAPEFMGRFQSDAGPCLVYRHVEGTHPTGKDDLALASALRRLHQISAPLALREIPSGSAAIAAQVYQISQSLSESSRKKLAACQPRSEVAKAQISAFLHGDVVPSNIVLAQWGPCFIDWQCPARGDPLEDIATYLSPAMRALYGGAFEPVKAEGFLIAYGDPECARRYRNLAPHFHWRMASYCLSRAELGDSEYAAAADLEFEALEKLHQQHSSG